MKLQIAGTNPQGHPDAQIEGDPPVLIWRGRALHSRRDPLLEAERRAGEIHTSEDQLVVFFGAGLGYVVRAFLSSREGKCVWFEPVPEILHAALETLDFSDAVDADRLQIYCGVPEPDVAAALLGDRGNEDVVFVPHRASYSADPVYGEIQKLCERVLNRREVNRATLARFDRDWARNLYSNFPFLTEARPVRELFGRAAGMPALICGAGPSLSQNLADVTRIRDQVLLICVDTAVHVLSAHGLDPDIVVTVDPQVLNRAHLEGYRGRAAFVVDPTTSCQTLRLLPPNRTFFAESPFPLARLFFSFLENQPGEIAFGGSVSTNAYDLAFKMGCTRIFLVGQDMSFPGGLAHAKGAVLEERLNYKEGRTFRREMHNYRQLSALPVRWLPAIHGGQTPTNDKLTIFYNWFTARFRRDALAGVQITNCTADGARIPGLAHEPSSQLPALLQAEEPADTPTRALLVDLRALLSGQRAGKQWEKTPFIDALEVLSRDFQAMTDVLDDSIRLSEEAAAVVQREGAAPPAVLKALDDCDEKLRKLSQATEIAGSTAQAAIFRITAKDGRKPPATDAENSLRTIQDAAMFYRDLREGCELHLRGIRKTVTRMRSGSNR